MIWAVCLTYVALALLYNAFTPIGEAPDEIHHFRYLRLVADERRLPGAADGLWQAHQAPLYYVIQAAWAKTIEAVSRCRGQASVLELAWAPGFLSGPNFNQYVHPPTERVGAWGCAQWSYHLLRLVSIVLTVPLVLLTFAILREAMPGSPTVVAVGGMLTALLPSHVFISSMLNNDALGNLTIVATTYVLVRACRIGDPSDAAKAGVLAAIAVTAKLSGMYLFGLLAVVVLWRRDVLFGLAGGVRARWWLLGACGAGVLPIVVVWRNLTQWGDAFAVGALESNRAALISGGAYRLDHGVLHYYAVELPTLFVRWLPVSYGAANFPYGGSFEIAHWGVPVVTVGLILSLLLRRPWRQVARRPLIVLVAGFALFLVTYVYPGYRYRWLQVRYFFGQLPLISLGGAIGVATLWQLVRATALRLPDRALVTLVYACLVALNILVLRDGVVGHLYRYVGAMAG